MAPKATTTTTTDDVAPVVKDNHTDINSSPPPRTEELLKRRKELIKQTWKVVETGLGVELTKTFYVRLFEKYPEVMPLFQSTDMDVMSKKLYEMLRVAIRFLDQFDELLPSLQEMGVRHATSYGVQRNHYAAVMEVFIEVLNEYLEVALLSPQVVKEESMAVFKLDIAAAWGWVLTLIGKTMADAAAAADLGADC